MTCAWMTPCAVFHRWTLAPSPRSIGSGSTAVSCAFGLGSSCHCGGMTTLRDLLNPTMATTHTVTLPEVTRLGAAQQAIHLGYPQHVAPDAPEVWRVGSVERDRRGDFVAVQAARGSIGGHAGDREATPVARRYSVRSFTWYE